MATAHWVQWRRPSSETLAPAVMCCLLALAGCGEGVTPALTRITEARRLTAELLVEVASAANASDRAVMADTDAASREFAEQAQRSTAQVEKDLAALEALVKVLNLEEEGRLIAALRAAFDKYRSIDREVLTLAVENTNLKAQRLSFGAAHEAADRVQAALEPVASTTSRSESKLAAALLALRATLAVREVEVLQAPHIAALEGAVMDELEQRMAKLQAETRAALSELEQSKDAESQAAAAAALPALANFDAAHREIIALSRRNSNVRSLALSLGEKIELVSSCQRKLDELSSYLDRRSSPASR